MNIGGSPTTYPDFREEANMSKYTKTTFQEKSFLFRILQNE